MAKGSRKTTVPGTPQATQAESEAKFRQLAELTASALFMVKGTRITYANPGMEKLSGYSQAGLAQLELRELFPDEGESGFGRWMNRIQTGLTSSLRGEFKIITSNREERWIDLSTALIEDEGERAVFITGFDITERKRADLLQDAVYRITRAADRSKRLDDLYPAVHAIIAEVMPAVNFFIALWDAEKGLMTFPYIVDEFDADVAPSKPGRGLSEYVIRTGKSLLCDLETHDRLEKGGEIELVGEQSPIWLGVPLSIDGDVIGTMVVQDYHDPLAYGLREQRVLEFVSSQVAMAIHRKRSEDSLQENEGRLRRRSDELAVLYETTREISTERNPQALLQTIVDRAAMLLNAAGGWMFLRSGEGEELELKVAYGYQGFVGMRLSVQEGLIGQVAQLLQPIALDDYRLWENRSNKFDALPMTANMAVPMLYGGELLGVISVYELDRDDGMPLRRYSTSDMEQLTFFAGSAAIAVHNTQLYQETRQRLVELDLLYQASLSSVQIHSVHAVAQRIVDALEHLLNWQGSIWLIEERKPALVAHCTMGLDGEQFKAMMDRSASLVPSLETGIVGWVCKNGRSLRTGNVKTNPQYVRRLEEINSELCVPLKIGGKTIGCIDVESPERDAFGEHDERLMNTLANQAAVGIENARLFEETRRRAVRQAALNAIISASARVGTNLDEILNIALEQTLKALNLDMGAIWLSWSPRSVYRIVSRGTPPSINAMLANAAASGDSSMARTLVVNDWDESLHGFAEMFQAIGVNSTIVVPLLAGEKRIGGLTVSSPLKQRWTPEEIALVESIGREVGLAAERAKLFEETTSRINELEMVNKISTTLRLAQSLEGMLPQLLDETLRALDADTGGIWLFDPQKGTLGQAIGKGWCVRAARLELTRGENLLGNVFTNDDVYFSNDVSTDPQVHLEFRQLAPEGWGGISVPIRTENQVIGAFMVFAPPPREFSGEEGRLLVTVTEIAGNAITRMRLNDQTLQHAAELETRVAARTAELQEALKKAQTADRLKSEFIANVNHELRTPLTNLVLYYQMLRAQPTVKTEDRLDVIGRELQRLRGLIEELLNLSRLDLGQVTLRPMPCNLGKLVQTLVNDRQALAEVHKLSLVTELEADLPSVPLDETTMGQAISNLLTNALNYTPAGGRVLAKTMKSEADGNGEYEVGIRVEDTGPGISEEDMPRLFERFYRGGTGRQSGAPGTGLGLAIVKQVVERHHGRIEVGKGAEGKGARFTIWLPVKNNNET